MLDISVIVPCYNSAGFIERCIASICKQSIAEAIEIIFVDDCSSDNTVELIKQSMSVWGSSIQYVIIQHPVNMGVALARKTGIQNASGEYILFCDSDDWLDNNMCELLHIEALRNNCEVVVCDYKNVYSDTSYDSAPCYVNDYLQGLLLCKCTGSLCNKLIKRSLILADKFIYPTASFCEDYVYSIQLAIYARKIGYVPKPLYNYCHREGSVVTSRSIEAIQNRISDNLANHQLVEYIIDNNGLKSLYYSELIFLKLLVKNSIRLHIQHNGFYGLWCRTYPELIWEIFKSPYVSHRSRIAYLLTLIGMYPIVKKIIKNA